MADLCEEQALLLNVVRDHLNARPSEDVLAVIADELRQKEEAELDGMEGCSKAGLQRRLFCDGMVPNLHPGNVCLFQARFLHTPGHF